MQKHYDRIANRLNCSAAVVHLIHFVLVKMKDSCIFPPSAEQTPTELFTAPNVCAAVCAYLESDKPGAHWENLQAYNITGSMQIGAIFSELQQHRKTKVIKGHEVEIKQYDALFDLESRSQHFKTAYWYKRQLDPSREESESAYRLLKAHFQGARLDSLIVRKRMFPEHLRADVQRALDKLLTPSESIQLLGLNPRHLHNGLSLRNLIDADQDHAVRVGPLTYSEVAIDDHDTISCLSNALWLAETNKEIRFTVVLGESPAHSGSGRIQIEAAVQESDRDQDDAELFLEALERQIESDSCYRGKILSFETEHNYRGHSAAIKVHALKHVERSEVILPDATLSLLDRNIIEFVKQRPILKQRGMNVKKGVLLFGPPGTGKTHTLHYLARALPATTTFLITSEQIGNLASYMNLARLLQPSLVIIEDADLIARQRERMDTCEEVLLNKLLNEMDGLKADAEIIFILSTNRPEALEAALTARPGRIDQAIEYPLPNETGRRQLAALYAGGQSLTEDVVEEIARRTENMSAAFIKELMRRATQFAITRGMEESIGVDDIVVAIEELLFSGGAFNRQILGASSDETKV